MTPHTKRLRPWLFSKDVFILYYGLQDNRSGILSKLPAVLAVVYLLFPFDLIPDVIPVLGYVDDLVVVPFLLNLSMRFLPNDVFHESIVKATANRRKFKLFIFAGIFVLIALIVGLIFLIRFLLLNS